MDLDGDGKAEIITGTGPGPTAEKRVFKGGDYGNMLLSEQPYGNFPGGIYVGGASF